MRKILLILTFFGGGVAILAQQPTEYVNKVSHSIRGSRDRSNVNKLVDYANYWVDEIPAIEADIAAIENAFIDSLGWYNVLSYGADPSDTLDDTEYIQNAINACFDNGGGVVYFPNGIYYIKGDLQNNVGDDTVDYNSQLYIPSLRVTDTDVRTVKLLGETPPPYLIERQGSMSSYGVQLRSTIEGSGEFPSVIASAGWSGGAYGPFNFTETYIENIIVMVNHDDTDGVTMCGINLLRAPHSYINEVLVLSDCLGRPNIVQPTDTVFGIGVGMYLDNFPRIDRASVFHGFFYGFVLGEGVHAQNITSIRNYIGVMFWKSIHTTLIDVATLHWNTYTISSQQKTMYEVDPSVARFIINNCSVETDEAPEWTHSEKFVLDSPNYLRGTVYYNSNLNNLPKTKTGGVNVFLINNRRMGQHPTWETATRPTHADTATIGFNKTTGKLEFYNGATWTDLH